MKKRSNAFERRKYNTFLSPIFINHMFIKNKNVGD